MPMPPSFYAAMQTKAVYGVFEPDEWWVPTETDAAAARDGGSYGRAVSALARLQARQHRHLSAAFDLEDTEGITPAEHVIDGSILCRHGSKIKWPAIMLL